MSSVCILDYGSGNVKSVLNLFSAIAKHVVISNDPAEIQQATHIILPGVGAFGAAMRKIHERLPIDVLEQVVLNEKRPFLGICVGMQVLATHGMEFGEYPGLGWLGGIVEKINSKHLPLPHIGWNSISCKQDSPLLTGLGDDPDFYFVHSYAFRSENEQYTVATTSYEEEFCSVVQRENIYGVQFHPEKSQRAGVKLAKNFVSIS
ncbi:MAG: imidazole glycerol phosphate synthase subunit HisH [Candidatus Methylumidiphilus sp.]|jgi:glutamine amidotransferase